MRCVCRGPARIRLPCPCSSAQAKASSPTTGGAIRQRAPIVRVVDGDAATAVLRRILPVGTRVRLVSDPAQARTDRYGRLLRYIAKGKLDVGKRLVDRGAAKIYVYNDKAFQRLRYYRGAQSSAQQARRGLWKSC